MTLTRKETIERLKQNKAAAEYYAGQSQITAEIENALKDSEALDMAIEALSADTESKVDPIVIRPKVYFGKSDFDKWAAEVKKESDRIIVIPHDAEVVVNTVKGLWVEEQDDWYGGGAWVCSICGYGYSFGAYHEANEFRYCPNCGARMEANE